jgi:hypothetical protein
MDVVLVVDTSGSMALDLAGEKIRDPNLQGPSRIDRVISALKRFAEDLPPGARLHLISFNSDVKTDEGFNLNTPQAKQQLIAKIEGLKQEVGSGATWLPEAMEKGLKYADQYASEDPDITTTLYALTDGKVEYGDPGKDAASRNFLSQVLAKSKYVGTDRLYASLVMLGKLTSKGGKFDDEYFADLKSQGGKNCDVYIDEDFNPLFPALLEGPQRALPGDDVKIIEASGRPFVRTIWEVDGKVQASPKPMALTLTNVKEGRHVITFKGFDKPDSERRARARHVLNVGQTPVKAVPEIFIDDKSLDSVGLVTQDQTMRLSHKSTGPVAKVKWKVNDETFIAESHTQQLKKTGIYEVALIVESERTPQGVVSTNTSAPRRFEVVPPRLTAVAEVLHDGKPYSESSHIYAGDTLQLVSKSTGPVKSAKWTVNGQQIDGNSVSWPIPDPGDIEILLKVQGQNPSQIDESLPLKVFAKKRPPVWALWAASIVGVFFLGLVWRLFIGNRPRLCRLESRLDPKSNVTLGRLDVAQYWNRLTKKAHIPMGEAVASIKGRVMPSGPTREVFEFWSKEGAKHPTRYFVALKASDPKVPAVLDCPFKNFGGIDCRPDLSADQNNPRFVFNYPEAPAATKKVYFNFAEVGSATADKLALVGLTALILALFFLFVVKIYPMLS